MTIIVQDDVRAAIAERDVHGRFGTPGYSLPDLDDVDVVPLLPGVSLPQVTVTGSAGIVAGHLVLHRKSNLRAKLTISCGPSVRNALVVIGRDCSLHGTIDLHAEDATVLLAGEASRSDHGGHFAARLWMRGNTLFMGKGCTSNGSQHVVSGNGRSIIIGDDCMFASNITLRTDDMHSIVDMETGQRLNEPSDIRVEPHVWLGQDVVVLKGVTIGLGSIVGALSLVVAGCPRFCVLGGVPAKILARHRTWDRNMTPTAETLARLRRLDEEVAALGEKI
jgi:acetyltransferase-like isoleucine patch superfamily enzyme